MRRSRIGWGMSDADFRWALIDSCGATATIAVGVAERVIATERVAGRAFSAMWAGVLRSLLDEAGWSISQLQIVGVVHGPGSFTGVRVGLAAAKGLCEAVGANLVAISRLKMLGDEEKLAVIDAGRDEYYVRDGGVERLLKHEGMIAAAQQRDVVTLDERVAELVPAKVIELSAVSAVPMLVARLRSGLFDDVAATDANYVRGEQDIYARQPMGK